MHCCHFQTRCTYQYGSTERFVLYIRVISHTDVHKQNLNTRTLTARPACISRYQIFINMTETAAVLTEDWGELLDLSVMVKAPTFCLSLSFEPNISIAL